MPIKNSKQSFSFLLWPIVSIFLCYVLALPDLQASVSLEQATRLKNDLTPLGAIRSANADGSIPAWNLEGMSPVEHRQWIKEIAQESPILTIDHTNIDDYRDTLSPGLQKLLTRYPDTFRIPVYPSHRTAKLPQWLYENAYKNALAAKITASEEEVTFAWPGIPFPIPKSGKEIMWNHELRWKGLFFKLKTYETTVNKNGAYNLIQNMLEVYSVYHNRNRPRQIKDWRYTYYLSYIKAPAKIAGGAYLSHESMKPMTKPRQSWMYVAGERRMRRSPVIGYDSPTFTSNGLRMMDEIDVFNGALDRYDWNLKGLREMYIPYNNERLKKELLNDEALLTPLHINPDFTRYEKHRVWVVDATLKAGHKHLYKRRTFYLDEDTWSIMLVDIYGEDDALWRVTQRYSAYYPDVPVTFPALDSYNDLKKESYYVQGFPEGYIHSESPPIKGYFSPTMVRQRLHR